MTNLSSVHQIFRGKQKIKTLKNHFKKRSYFWIPFDLWTRGLRTSKLRSPGPEKRVQSNCFLTPGTSFGRGLDCFWTPGDPHMRGSGDLQLGRYPDPDSRPDDPLGGSGSIGELAPASDYAWAEGLLRPSGDPFLEGSGRLLAGPHLPFGTWRGAL